MTRERRSDRFARRVAVPWQIDGSRRFEHNAAERNGGWGLVCWPRSVCLLRCLALHAAQTPSVRMASLLDRAFDRLASKLFHRSCPAAAALPLDDPPREAGWGGLRLGRRKTCASTHPSFDASRFGTQRDARIGCDSFGPTACAPFRAGYRRNPPRRRSCSIPRAAPRSPFCTLART